MRKIILALKGQNPIAMGAAHRMNNVNNNSPERA
jgi:hypothetical protein